MIVNCFFSIKENENDIPIKHWIMKVFQYIKDYNSYSSCIHRFIQFFVIDHDWEWGFPKNQIHLIKKGIYQLCVDGGLENFKIIISVGINCNKQDEDDFTPLHSAC